MKSRKQTWSIALCLLAAMGLAIGLRARSTTAQSNAQPPQHATSGIAGQPLLATSLPAAMVPASVLFADVSGRQTLGSIKPNPDLPPVEEFTLTPPNPALKMYKTIVAVRFPELAAEKLVSQIPMRLGDQNVVLQRSADDARIFSAAVDFDWSAFAKEQQQRKELAASGRVIPVFQGRRFVGMEKIQFVDPVDIQSALQSHQSLQFNPQILLGTGFTVDPQTELMVTDPNVVEDPARTFNPCENNGQGSGTKMGPWTFGALMLNLLGQGATQQQAEQVVENWLKLWTVDQQVNHFDVQPRAGMANTVIPAWPTDPLTGNLVDISRAPFQLNAIVNRIDLGEGSSPNTNAGELRFVFGYAPCVAGEGSPKPFNVIFEYNVPASVASGCSGPNSVQQYADLWLQVETDFEACGNSFSHCAAVSDLEVITDKVVTVAANAMQNLNRVRSNENVLGGGTGNEDWEMREFSLTPNGQSQQPPFIEVPIFETPQGNPDPNSSEPNFGLNTVLNGNQQFSCSSQPTKCQASVLTTFINGANINFPGTYIVPTTFGSGATQQPFQGGSAFQPVFPGAYWNGSGTINGGQQTRSNFSANTCNGCHGAETQTRFQQVVNDRVPAPLGQALPADLAAFLVGCSNKPSVGITAPCLPPSQGGTNSCNLQNATASLGCVNELVQDPALGLQQAHPNSFGDLSRRSTYMGNVLGGNCQADLLLQGLVQHRVNFSH